MISAAEKLDGILTAYFEKYAANHRKPPYRVKTKTLILLG
jgi:hypothetical protein